MSLLLDSFWRAVAYCLRPGVILLSLLPLMLISALAVGLGYFFWDDALQWVRAWLESNAYLNALWAWLDQVGLGRLKMVLVPLLVIFGVTPLIVIVSLLLVGVLMTPALVRLVATRRFPDLQAAQASGFWGSVFWSLGSTVMALIAMLISVPLWLVPPLVLILPPLIWGWLAYRIMAFDALSGHATAEERKTLMHRHRLWLLGMGVLTGYLGAAPSLVWASGALFAAAFVILVPLAVWIYTVVFAFASLWFSHYCLAALAALRKERGPSVAQPGDSAEGMQIDHPSPLANDIVDVPSRELPGPSQESA